ncbi:MAG: hypothetical protein CMN06_06640 [Roseibacillus sp.]|nr:hypothetical protein [Roseibacillus sp.]
MLVKSLRLIASGGIAGTGMALMARGSWGRFAKCFVMRIPPRPCGKGFRVSDLTVYFVIIYTRLDLLRSTGRLWQQESR